MSSTAGPDEHPIAGAVAGMTALLDEVAGCRPTYLTREEKERVLLGATRLVVRLEALRAATLAVAGDVAEEHAARDAAAWLAHATGHDAATGRRWQRLATGLERRWPALAEAYAAGRVSTEQVAVIGRSLDQLPADVDDDLRLKAEHHLVEQGGLFSPRELGLLGRRVLDVLAPDVAEAHEARLLEREERQAHDDATLHHWRVGHGQTKVQLRLPDAAADRLMVLLHSFASPRQSAPDDDRSYPTKLAHGFITLLERIPPDLLPQHGGTSTSLMVLIDHERLTHDLAVAELSTGTPVTAGEARRLACGAGILPMVLGGQSQPLDLGRTKRFFSSAQNKALAVRDGGCVVDGCGTPASWTEAHHLDPWSTGGRTDLARALSLCGFHHHRAHDRRYRLDRLLSGKYAFHRRS